MATTWRYFDTPYASLRRTFEGDVAFHIDRFLETTVSMGATELYLYPGQEQQLWIEGQMRKLQTRPVSAEVISAATEVLCSAQVWQDFNKAGCVGFEYNYKGKADFRVRLAIEHGAIAAVFSRI